MRRKQWLALGALFIAINFAGGIAAALQGEVRHAGVHGVLLILGALFVRQLLRGSWRGAESVTPKLTHEVGASLAHLEQAVDAVALEVERIGEAQRYITRFVADNRGGRLQDAGATEPIEIKSRDSTQPSKKPQEDR
jgi:hypothetical protein